MIYYTKHKLCILFKIIFYKQVCNQKYLEQLLIWSQKGQHMLANFDDNAMVVYQAYWSTTDYALKH